MHRYIALLRGINVGGHKKVLMADLKTLFISIGFTDIITYIQSGNVVFLAEESDQWDVVISARIKENYGWDVPVLVRTSKQLAAVLHHCPFSEEKKEKSYFTLFQEEPCKDAIADFNALDFPGEEFHLNKRCLYFFCAEGYARVKMNNNLIERKLKVRATTRNYKTLQKLIELSA